MKLTTAEIELLRDTLEIYEGAGLGRLNASADELRRVVTKLGGPAVACRTWAHDVLASAGIEVARRA